MKRKLIPPFLMLFAGLVSSIIMFMLHYDTKKMLAILFAVLIAFYIIGCLFKLMLDIFDRQNMAVETDDEDDHEEISSEEQEGQVNIES